LEKQGRQSAADRGGRGTVGIQCVRNGKATRGGSLGCSEVAAEEEKQRMGGISGRVGIEQSQSKVGFGQRAVGAAGSTAERGAGSSGEGSE